MLWQRIIVSVTETCRISESSSLDDLNKLLTSLQTSAVEREWQQFGQLVGGVGAFQGQTVMVVGHGALNQVLLVVALGGTSSDLWLEQRIDNCQISRLEWTPDAGLNMIELM